jgi:hypothetical protein
MLGGRNNPADVTVIPTRQAPRSRDHRPGNVDGVYPSDTFREWPGQVAGATAEVQHRRFQRISGDQAREDVECLGWIWRAMLIRSDDRCILELRGVFWSESWRLRLPHLPYAASRTVVVSVSHG